MLRNAKIDEVKQLEFFTAITTMTRDETLVYCTDLIESARAPNYTLMNQLKSMSKDRMIIAMNNFVMKGQGYGV
tara:strand:+ start:1337 stop:1558 length:222 start_codon:yes stop_codon:yes gene_type:complete